MDYPDFIVWIAMENFICKKRVNVFIPLFSERLDPTPSIQEEREKHISDIVLFLLVMEIKFKKTQTTFFFKIVP